MSYKNILLMGKSGSGKSSMRNMIFSNYSAIDTRRLGATIDVERTQIRLLNNLNLSLMDCGGQDSYMLNYIKAGSTKLNNAELLIYVFDIEGTQPKDFEIFNLILNTLKNLSPRCKIFLLVHKMDLVNEEEREKVFLDFYVGVKSSSNLKFFLDQNNVQCAQTSIWDESLYKAWSQIVGSLIPETQALQKHLKNLGNIVSAEFIMIFETSTFLKIATHPNSLPKDEQADLDSITQRVSGIIKNYKKSVEKISARFRSLTLYANSKSIYLDNLTDNMVIMIVIPDSKIEKDINKSTTVKISEEKYVQDVIKRARKTFEKLDFSGKK
ncbi:Rag GTPase [Saccharomycopsis crataegensis]|uniref:GTP-binding protein n=1 Tax=Saccharomycopsis crataegensis TaxID=43959 RepID=A0AAV5QN11_9ASCO|nr:Rag GTPase [Saccharomycopsis crataegensis]